MMNLTDLPTAALDAAVRWFLLMDAHARLRSRDNMADQDEVDVADLFSQMSLIEVELTEATSGTRDTHMQQGTMPLLEKALRHNMRKLEGWYACNVTRMLIEYEHRSRRQRTEKREAQS